MTFINCFQLKFLYKGMIKVISLLNVYRCLLMACEDCWSTEWYVSTHKDKSYVIDCWMNRSITVSFSPIRPVIHLTIHYATIQEHLRQLQWQLNESVCCKWCWSLWLEYKWGLKPYFPIANGCSNSNGSSHHQRLQL